jgi:centromeric protein E
VLCCASPSPSFIEETRSTLKFASRAKLVQVHAKKNEVMDDRSLIKRLQRELAAAKKALREAEDRERRHVATVESESAANMRQKLTKLESVILSPKGKDRSRASKPLAASLDPALWRRTPQDGPSHRYSVVDMPIGLETLLVIEEDEADIARSSDLTMVSPDRPTSESDILKEALKKKSDTNRELNDELDRLNAQIASLAEERDAYKAERDKLAASTISGSDNAYENDDATDCLLPARRTFWQILFGNRQNLLDCCKSA